MKQLTTKQKTQMIKFSIIMASKLSNFKGGATDRVAKFKRAIDSVMNQTYRNWELIIVADNCDLTIKTTVAWYSKCPQIIGFNCLGERPLFTGFPRNTGIENATGDYVVYLDTDDEFTPTYLEQLNVGILNATGNLFWVNDLIHSRGEYKQRDCSLKLGGCGTSNIVHPATTTARWPEFGAYAHDWLFIKRLREKHGNGLFLSAVGYKVNHIPGHYDI